MSFENLTKQSRLLGNGFNISRRAPLAQGTMGLAALGSPCVAFSSMTSSQVKIGDLFSEGEAFAASMGSWLVILVFAYAVYCLENWSFAQRDEFFFMLFGWLPLSVAVALIAPLCFQASNLLLLALTGAYSIRFIGDMGDEGHLSAAILFAWSALILLTVFVIAALRVRHRLKKAR